MTVINADVFSTVVLIGDMQKQILPIEHKPNTNPNGRGGG